MNMVPTGLYLEDEKRLEFDFAKHLLKISFYNGSTPAGSVVSPFSIVKNADGIYLLIHNYGRLGERKALIKSVGKNNFSVNLDNHLYKLQRVA